MASSAGDRKNMRSMMTIYAGAVTCDLVRSSAFGDNGTCMERCVLRSVSTPDEFGYGNRFMSIPILGRKAGSAICPIHDERRGERRPTCYMSYPEFLPPSYCQLS